MFLRFIAVITLALTCFSCSKKQENEAVEQKKSLESSLKGADQLTVITPFIGGKDLRGREGRIVAVINGEQKLQDFIDLIDFKTDGNTPGCDCKLPFILKFQRKGDPLISLGYHHVSAFRWSGGAWKGDRALTDKSLVGILEWFSKQGFKEPELTYQKAKALEKKRKKSFAFISKHFDESRQKILQKLNVGIHVPDSKTLPPQAVSDLLYESYDDKTQLLDVAFKIFGAKESARGRDLFEQVIIKAVEPVNQDSYSRYLHEKKAMTNEEKMGMSCFLFFQHKLTKQLYEEHPEKIITLAQYWLEHEFDYELGVIGMNTILQLNKPKLNELYKPYAQGVKSLNLKRRSRSFAPVVDIRCLILLKRAEFGDQSVIKYCDALLEKKKSQIERSIMKISKALLDGDLKNITAKDFEYRVSFLIKSRRLLAKKYPSLKSYDILIAGTNHAFSNVQSHSVLAIEELTGKKWIQNKKNERIEWHGKDIRAWWAKNRETYKFPKQ